MRSYGISTLTLKNLCVELVGAQSTVSDERSLPSIVYFRRVPLVLRFGDHVMYGTSFEMAINAFMHAVCPDENIRDRAVLHIH